MAQLPAQKDSRRGLLVNEYLVVKGTENVWAVGDCAVANYAPTAQVAGQEGAFLARMFNQMAKTDAIEHELAVLSDQQATAKNGTDRDGIFARIKELQKSLRRIKHIGPFEYSHQGSLAYIGSEKAVADISWLSGNVATGGTLTYLFWRSAYLSMCFSSKFPPYLQTDYANWMQRGIVFWCCLIGSRRRCLDGMCHESNGRFVNCIHEGL